MKIFFYLVVLALQPLCHGLKIDIPSTRIVSKIEHHPVPTWVVAHDYDTNFNISKHEDYAILLKEYQVNFEEREVFHRQAFKYLNPSSIDFASDLSFQLFYSVEVFKLHYVRIIRNGVVTDRLENSELRLECIPKKKNLIFDDEHQLIIFLNNLQPGDILEFAATKKYNCPLTFYEVNFSNSRHVNKFICRVLSKHSCFFKKFFTDAKHIQNKIGSQFEYKWELKDLDIIENLVGAPSWYRNEPRIEVSTTSLWNKIREFKNQEIRPEKELPSKELLAIADHIKNKNTSIEDQILAACRFVTNDIFYRSLNSGHQAYSPNTVLKRGYGDCKDKTYLLVELLKLLNVHAFPVLVNPDLKYTIIDHFPNYSFGHLIACIEFEGDLFYVDPTITNSGGRLKNMFIGNYGYGLFLNNKSKKLSKIFKRAPLPAKRRTYQLNIDQEKNTAYLKVNFNHFSDCANKRRGYLYSGSESIVTKQIKKMIEKKFGDSEVIQEIQFNDDIDLNSFDSSLSFLLKSIGKQKGSEREYVIESEIYTDSLYKIDPKRQAPYAVIPLIEEEQFVITFSRSIPKNVRIEKFYYKDPNLECFVDWKKISDKELEIHFKYAVFTDHIEASDYTKFHESVSKFEKMKKVVLRDTEFDDSKL